MISEFHHRVTRSLTEFLFFFGRRVIITLWNSVYSVVNNDQFANSLSNNRWINSRPRSVHTRYVFVRSVSSCPLYE